MECFYRAFDEVLGHQLGYDKVRKIINLAWMG
ncbi:hypothetical protein ABID42_002895 [Arcicella rosea]